jgi:hypothetical protein
MIIYTILGKRLFLLNWAEKYFLGRFFRLLGNRQALAGRLLSPPPEYRDATARRTNAALLVLPYSDGRLNPVATSKKV